MSLIEIPSFLAASIALNFFLLVVLLIFNFRTIKKQFSDVKKTTWFILILIFIMGFFIRFTVPEYHKMYIDEQWNMDVGKNILTRGQAEHCSYIDYDRLSCITSLKPVGVSFIYAISFLIFGVNNFIAIKTTTLLGSLSIVLIFLFGYLLFKNEHVGLFSALFLSLFSLHIFWSASAETNVISVFFILLTLLLFLIYVRVNTIKVGVLAISSLTYALQTRIDYILLLPLIGIMFLIFDKNWKDKIKNQKFWIPWLICGLFFISWFVQVFISYEYLSSNYVHSNGLNISVAKNVNLGFGYLQLKNFEKNILSYSSKLIGGFYLPFVIGIFIFVGLLNYKKNKQSCFFVTILFLLFFIFFMFYDAVQNRFLLPSLLGLIFLAGYGADSLFEKIREVKYNQFISALLIILVLASFYPYLGDTYLNKNNKKILETQIPELANKDIPKNCIIIAPMPEIFTATTKIKAIRSETIVENPDKIKKFLNKTNCVLFFEGLACFYKSELREDTPKYRKKSIEQFDGECNFMKNNYKLSPYREYKSSDDGNLTFRFHKISI